MLQSYNYLFVSVLYIRSFIYEGRLKWPMVKGNRDNSLCFRSLRIVVVDDSMPNDVRKCGFSSSVLCDRSAVLAYAFCNSVDS